MSGIPLSDSFHLEARWIISFDNLGIIKLKSLKLFEMIYELSKIHSISLWNLIFESEINNILV